MKNFNLRKFLVENKLTTQSKLISEENSSDLDFDDFMKKFPEVKDDNLAGEVYDIMQQQNGFDDYEDEEYDSDIGSELSEESYIDTDDD